MAADAACTASKHAVVGLAKSPAVTYGRASGFALQRRGPAPITNIVANWGFQLAAERLGPVMPVNIPAPDTAAQPAASITLLLSADGTNISGAIFASDGGWPAL